MRKRLGAAAIAVAFAAAGTALTTIGTAASTTASPGTPCAPSVQCWIKQVQCIGNKFCD